MSWNSHTATHTAGFPLKLAMVGVYCSTSAHGNSTVLCSNEHIFNCGTQYSCSTSSYKNVFRSLTSCLNNSLYFDWSSSHTRSVKKNSRIFWQSSVVLQSDSDASETCTLTKMSVVCSGATLLLLVMCLLLQNVLWNDGHRHKLFWGNWVMSHSP